MGTKWAPGENIGQLKLVGFDLTYCFELVARGGLIGGADWTDERSESARRVRIGLGRSESIEPPTRGFSANRYHNPTWPKVTQQNARQQILNTVGYLG